MNAGPETVLIGCTSTTTSNIGLLNEPATYCVDRTPISTINPVQSPTGTPAAPSCYPEVDLDTYSTQVSGYAPDPVFFEAAIGVFCGDNCLGTSNCFAATGKSLNSWSDPEAKVLVHMHSRIKRELIYRLRAIPCERRQQSTEYSAALLAGFGNRIQHGA